MNDVFGYLLAAVTGAGILAAGLMLRHRYIRPERPVQLPPGNPWEPKAGGEQGEGWR